jgi:biopolymer transport protein ExbD
VTIRFQCTKCGKRLKAGPEHAGRRVACPRCGHKLVVPSAVVPAELAAPAAAPTADEAQPLLRFGLKRLGDDELDLTPMVDVTFQLLIFFMLTMAMGLQKSIEVPTPNRSSQPAAARTLEDFEEDEDYIIVRIDADDTIWVEESEATKLEIVPKLRKIREEGRKPGAPPPGSMLVLASGEAHHETVVAVLDAGTEVGMQNVRLSALDEEEDL